MKYPDYGEPSHSIEGLEETLNLFKNSISDFVHDLPPIKQDNEKSQPRITIREWIPHRQF